MKAIAGSEELDGQRHGKVVEQKVDGKLQDGFIRRVVNRQDIGERGQAPNDASQADNDEGSVHKGREQDLPKLSGDVSLQHVPDWMKLGVVGVADEV